MTNTITYSSELMKNYKQADIMAPDTRFEAVQTASGCALLFSIGSDNALYLTQETPGHSSGWERSDIGAAVIARDFAGQTGMSCKSFDVAQQGQGGAIGLALVVSDPKNDHLYLSLGNPNTDAAWAGQPAFTAYPFDDPNRQLAVVKIVNVLLGEASDRQYVVVDVLRDAASANPLVCRYYIDVDKTGGYAWHPHDLALDLSPGTYTSCLGRRPGQLVDGLYTCGRVDGLVQFEYQQLYNPWNPAEPPQPDLYTMPGGVVPDMIASVRNADHSSDLYVTGQGALYYLASANQGNAAVPVLLATNAIFTGLTSLFAATSGGKVVVWGLNRANQVFYTSCALGSQSDPAAWTYPLPLLDGAQQISPYLNAVDNSNSFFAHTGANQITRAVKSPLTSLWTFQQITLTAPTRQGSVQPFSSYTTRIQVNDATGQPVANASVQLAAVTRTNVYINDLYYVLDSTPIPVETDALGTITVVQWISELAGTRLIVTNDDGSATHINPMDSSFRRATALQSPDALASAVITRQDGTTSALVPPGTSSNDLQQVSNANAQLASVYATLSQGGGAAPAVARTRVLQPATPERLFGSVASDVGDLYRYLASAVDAVVSLVQDTAEGVWKFVVTLGDQVFTAVLEHVEQVVGAVQCLYDLVKTAVADLINYLEFLFDWDDISRSKKVLHNLTRLYLADQIAGIATVKNDFDGLIASAENSINNWAGMSNWSGLGAAATASLSSSSAPTSGGSAPSALLAYHLQHNIANASYTAPDGSPSGSNPFTIVLAALDSEKGVIDGVVDQLATLARQYGTMNLDDILESLLGIITDAALGSAQVIVNALFELLAALATSALDLLDTPIYIPVVSDILSAFGVSSLSVLDVFCWVGAMAVTTIYKLAENVSPFPDDDHTALLISATDFSSVVVAYGASAEQARYGAKSSAMPMVALAEAPSASGMRPVALTVTDAAAVARTPLQRTMFIIGHTFCGFFTLMTAVVGTMEAAGPAEPNACGVPAAILGILGGVAAALPNTLTPSFPIANSAISDLSSATAGIRILSKLLIAAKGETWGLADPRKTGATIDAALLIPNIACTCWHFYELSQDDAGGTRSQAIIEETCNVTQYIARTAYTLAVSGGEKLIPLALYAGANVCAGGLQIAEAGVGDG